MNIENKSELLNYLRLEHQFETLDSDLFEVLRGGVSNRTVLYEGKSTSIVIKQALKKLRTQSDWYSDPERLKVEANALKWFNTFLPENTVPNQIFFDQDNMILGMQAVPHPHDNLKSLLMKKHPAGDLITKMGELLASIHLKGSKDTDAKNIFWDRTYFQNLRIEPYYEYTSSQIPSIKSFIDQLIRETLETKLTIVHGDYSPKNILIREGQLVLLDHEVMHFGDPAFDVGFSLTHLLSKANHFADKEFIDYAEKLWMAYSSKFPVADKFFEHRCIKHTLACILARVHGRSPLEYLNEDQKAWQSKFCQQLIKKNPTKLSEVFDQFKQLIERTNNENRKNKSH